MYRNIIHIFMVGELLNFAACHDTMIVSTNVPKHADVHETPLSTSQLSHLAIQERFTTGSFGYETYVNSSCTGDYVYVYGYVLNECSSTSSSTSLRYDWCGISNDGVVYFNIVRYNSVNCVGTPSWNYTYPISQDCDHINARKPLCVPDTEGWIAYGLKQHSM